MEKKITEREIYAMIKEEMADNKTVVNFCDKKIAQLDKKKNTNSKKTDEVFNKNMELVYDALVEMNKPVTATELIANSNLDELANDSGLVTTQKVSVYLNRLVENGRVTKFTEKKHTYFKLVEVESTDESADEDSQD